MSEKTEFINYYKILECNRDARFEEIKKNYQRLALTLHPDKREDKGTLPFSLLQKAWSVLRDPTTRKQYDAELICQEHSELLIYETINVKDMELLPDDGIYTYNCRCGGKYLLEVSDSILSTVIIGCDECSFSIQINF